MLLGVVELFFTHHEQCHKVANFTNDEIQIDECPELFTDHEEGDTRLLLHAKHASSHHNDVIIHSSKLCDALIGFHAFTGRDSSYNINNTVYANYIADLFFFLF